MKLHHLLVAIPLAALLLVPAWIHAGEGHDHGEAAPSASGPALPRFTAESELFELVGVLKGKQITLYLDRTVDNSPVTEAQIELEIAGKKYKAEKQGADEFEVVLTDAPKTGVLPITATVTAGNETDLLAGELDIHEAAPTVANNHVHSWKEYAGWVAGGVVALVLLVWLLTWLLQRLKSSRTPSLRSAA